MKKQLNALLVRQLTSVRSSAAAIQDETSQVALEAAKRRTGAAAHSAAVSL
jgi:hypothetical protein